MIELIAQIDYYVKSIDPVIDVVGGIGFIIAIVAVVYLQERKNYGFTIYAPFGLLAIAFGLLAAEGGAIDFLPPGWFRLLALLALLGAECIGFYATLRPEIDAYKYNTTG